MLGCGCASCSKIMVLADGSSDESSYLEVVKVDGTRPKRTNLVQVGKEGNGLKMNLRFFGYCSICLLEGEKEGRAALFYMWRFHV